MIKRSLITFTGAALLSLVSVNAQAILIISDVSFTSNSVTFTADGDMTGYSPDPVRTDQFSLIFTNDMYTGGVATGNSWSQSIFDNRSISAGGHTGGFSSSNPVPYAWSRYSGSLAGAVANNRTVTLTMSQNFLDSSSSNAVISFAWGNGLEPSENRILTSIDVNNQNPTTVPEPASLALLGVGLMGMVATRRRREKLPS